VKQKQTSGAERPLCLDPVLVFIGAWKTPFFSFFFFENFIETKSSLLEFCEARSDGGPLCFDPLLVFIGACNTPFFILFFENFIEVSSSSLE
jgi:hypothetical protein